MPVLNTVEWESFLKIFPDAHILQTNQWGELKQAFGWRVERIAVFSEHASDGIGAQVLFKSLPLGMNLAYIPRGPVVSTVQPAQHPLWAKWLDEVDQLCRRRNVVFMKIEPDLWSGSGENSFTGEEDPIPPGFLYSSQDIQPSRTLLVDLSGDEEMILARMKQKTRYNVRLALKKGVVVNSSQDIVTFHRLMMLTGQRDVFGVHNQEYYQKVFDLFSPSGACQVLLAEYEGEPLAAVMVFSRGKRAWYFYGASSNQHRERMPAYLLQWEAMRWARSQGCTYYDLWGVPDENLQTLEDQFLNRSAGLWGVYRFKRGFGGELKRVQGPWDRVYKPFWYSLYLRYLKFRQRNNEA